MMMISIKSIVNLFKNKVSEITSMAETIKMQS